VCVCVGVCVFVCQEDGLCGGLCSQLIGSAPWAPLDQIDADVESLAAAVDAKLSIYPL
jgi:hypothetical protein